MTGAAKGTILKLLADVGKACSEYQDKTLRNLTCETIQADEIWAFCYSKDKNVPKEKQNQFGYGDVYTFTAICADSKLVPTWYIGQRDYESAQVFMKDLASRLVNKVQLTTDGLRSYIEAVEDAFGMNVDFSQLIKVYGTEKKEGQTRYSPAKCTGTITHRVNGHPDTKKVSTSYVERQNLTTRMSMRRFTRLTNAFSKKVENLEHAIALHFMHYNFCRVHKTIKTTPAIAAGVTDKKWSVEDIAKLLNSN